MLVSRTSRRHMSVTLRAWPEKNIAACPAELPAPTMWTSRARELGRARHVVRPLAAREAIGPLSNRRDAAASVLDGRLWLHGFYARADAPAASGHTRWSARSTPPGSETTSIGSTGPRGRCA